LAYDNIMVFPERFKDHILPDKTHMLNVAFLVPEMRRNFGGCAGNIAYSLKKLGGRPLPMAAVGADFDRYSERLDELGINQTHILRDDAHFTAQAYITTDLDDNQITAFHPGAMNENHRNLVPADGSVRYGIVSPDGKQAMVDHSAQFKAAGIPHVFDPGQGLPMFGAAELKRFIQLADVVAVNDYEGKMLMQRTGLDETQIAAQVRALVVTRAAEGSVIMAGGERLEIPAAAPAAVVDPTGCGDAYRAGLLHGLMHGADWATTGRIASLMGAIKVESAGTQNHSFDRESFYTRYEASFGRQLHLGS